MPRYTAFSTVSLPLRPVCSYGPYERIQADIVDMAPGKKRSPYKWSLFLTNNIGQYASRTLFGTLYVRGKQRTVFLTPRERTLSFLYIRVAKVNLQHFPSLVLCSASSMLRVKSVQLFLHQGRKVKLQHFTPRYALLRT